MTVPSSPRVLHLVAGDLNGGAARGAYWLHRAQRRIGIDSIMLTNAGSNLGDDSVIVLGETPAQKLKFSLMRQLGKLPLQLYPKRNSEIFHTGFEGIDVTNQAVYQQADIVHLHWINGLVRIAALRKIQKPVVWTLRDMWPLTGGCHYSMGCDRYTVGCGQCPQLQSRKARDLSTRIVRNKRKSFPKKLWVIGISDWLSQCASDSAVFAGFPIQTIGNNVDTREFFPEDRMLARQILGLRVDKKILLIGAQHIKDFYKGFDLFLEALKDLPDNNLHVLTFGKNLGDALTGLGAAHTDLGFLSDMPSLRMAYSAADVLVAPSRMEAFGKTLVEAMACGTPVVCFDATGPKDIVEHKLNGYKAKPFDPSELALGIQWVLNRPPSEYEALCQSARERVEKCFDARVIAERYYALYARILASSELATL